MTAGDYVQKLVEINTDRLCLVTVEEVFNEMSDTGSIGAKLDHMGSYPEVIAFTISELMKGDEVKTTSLYWQYLRVYQRYSLHAGVGDIALLGYVDRFAAVTDQTSVHSQVLEDGNSVNWGGGHYSLGLSFDSVQQTLEEPQYLSLIANCNGEKLKRFTRVAKGNIGVALGLSQESTLQYQLEAVPMSNMLAK